MDPVSAMTVIGGGFQILGGIMSWEQNRIALQGQIEQYDFTIQDLELQMGGAAAINDLQMEQFDTMTGYVKQNAALEQERITSQLAQNQERQKQMDMQLAQLENKGQILDSQKVQQELGKDTVEAKKSINQIEANHAEMADAMKRGDIKLARNAATREGRLKTAVRKLSMAGQGRSGFAKAFESMTVNQNASFDQQAAALEGEGMFRRSAFDQGMRILGNESKSLDENINQLTLEQSNINIDKSINRSNKSILAEDALQLGITSDQVEAQMQYELDSAQNQREQTQTAWETSDARGANQIDAAVAAQENVQEQQDVTPESATSSFYNQNIGPHAKEAAALGFYFPESI